MSKISAMKEAALAVRASKIFPFLSKQEKNEAFRYAVESFLTGGSHAAA